MATGLIVNLRPGVLILGALLGPLACLLLLAAAVLPRPATPLPELMGSLWVIGHVAAIYAGYGLFTLNFLAGALYLVQDAQIRGKSLGPVFKRLPPLGRLEALGQRALYAGFALFTLGLVAGAVYAQLALGSYWRWDPKEVWSLVTWLLYAALLHTRLAQGWRGRRGAWLGALAFAALVFTYLGAGLLLSGYHSFDELRQLKGRGHEGAAFVRAGMRRAAPTEGGAAMNLVLVGMSHATAPVELRNVWPPAGGGPGGGGAGAFDPPAVREALFLATCNRVEALVLAEGTAVEAAGQLAARLTTGRQRPAEELGRCLYFHQGDAAVRHIFRVASSLDSLVVGEPQILGQLKEAYRQAVQAGACRAVLNRLLHKTFSVAKRVRTETSIGGAAVSVAYAAVELARKIFDDLGGLDVLLLGAGEMAELAAEHLRAQGVARVCVANRTRERAVELCARLGGGRAYSLAQLPEALAGADIVIASTGAPQPLVSPELARQVQRVRRGRPVFLIDIAVPRDVDPKVGRLDGFYLYDLDDLAQVVEKNRASRRQAAETAEMIVAEEVRKFGRWLETLAAVPTIAELSAKAEALRQAELARTLKDLGGLAPEQTAALERLTRSLVKKLLHDPILFLREECHGKTPELRREQLALVRRLFHLEENEGE